MSSVEGKAKAVPERLGRYRLVRLLSKGGMAEVYEARRESIAGVSPKVALKLIDPKRLHDKAYRQLFINEAQVSSNLRHQNLVQIQDFDESDGFFFLVMEFVEGMTLRRLIGLCRRHGIPIPQSLIAEIGRQICDGLHYAHQAHTPTGTPLGLVHRDVKPSNLMINPQGVVKVLDFGVSHASTARERPGAVRGTWGYMAPEQAAGKQVTAKTDLFGLAVVLYEMASLQPMIENKKDIPGIKKILAKDTPARLANSLPKNHLELSTILVRALQRDPEARYANAAEMGRELSKLVPDLVRARQELVSFWKELLELIETGQRQLTPFDPDDPSGGPPPKRDASRNQFGFLMLMLFLFLTIVIIFAFFQVQKSTKPVASKVPPKTIQKSKPSAPSEKLTVEKVPETRKKPSKSPVPKKKTVVKTKGKTKERVKPTSLPATEKQVQPAAEEQVPTTTQPNDKLINYGRITVSADREAQVFINGKFIRKAPLYRYKVNPGTYRVHVAHKDGRVKRFPVDVQAGDGWVFMWSFYENRWLKKAKHTIKE